MRGALRRGNASMHGTRATRLIAAHGHASDRGRSSPLVDQIRAGEMKAPGVIRIGNPT
jgi:hypothetical protein